MVDSRAGRVRNTATRFVARGVAERQAEYAASNTNFPSRIMGIKTRLMDKARASYDNDRLLKEQEGHSPYLAGVTAFYEAGRVAVHLKRRVFSSGQPKAPRSAAPPLPRPQIRAQAFIQTTNMSGTTLAGRSRESSRDVQPQVPEPESPVMAGARVSPPSSPLSRHADLDWRPSPLLPVAQLASSPIRTVRPADAHPVPVGPQPFSQYALHDFATSIVRRNSSHAGELEHALLKDDVKRVAFLLEPQVIEAFETAESRAGQRPPRRSEARSAFAGRMTQHPQAPSVRQASPTPPPKVLRVSDYVASGDPSSPENETGLIKLVATAAGHSLSRAGLLQQAIDAGNLAEANFYLDPHVTDLFNAFEAADRPVSRSGSVSSLDSRLAYRGSATPSTVGGFSLDQGAASSASTLSIPLQSAYAPPPNPDALPQAATPADAGYRYKGYDPRYAPPLVRQPR